MKRSELKKLIKPIVKECIQEALFEDGVLSKVISEVMMGIMPQSQIVEAKAPAAPIRDNKETIQKERQKLNETKRKMLDAIGNQAYNGVNLFEGTAPLKNAGRPGASEGPTSPLAGVAPNDPGIDISSLMGNARVWKQIVNS
jgi:hypothetical protein|tara:strand:+ start:559 stop:984 length:426 start_codon:yes stop_codon:yes gene_type:complete